MGQQQIILILLVTVIVAFATIIAINTMEQSHINSNHDAIRQKMMEVNTLAQGYYYKNRSMGGGGGSFQDITFEHINVDTSDNELGEFSIEPGDQSLTITAVPSAGGENIIGVIYKDRIEFQQAGVE